MTVVAVLALAGGGGLGVFVLPAGAILHSLVTITAYQKAAVAPCEIRHAISGLHRLYYRLGDVRGRGDAAKRILYVVHLHPCFGYLLPVARHRLFDFL